MTETNAQKEEETTQVSISLTCTVFGLHVWSEWEDKQYVLGWGYQQFRHCLRCNLVDKRVV
jgi:hypothetical protein